MSFALTKIGFLDHTQKKQIINKKSSSIMDCFFKQEYISTRICLEFLVRSKILIPKPKIIPENYQSTILSNPDVYLEHFLSVPDINFKGYVENFWIIGNFLEDETLDDRYVLFEKTQRGDKRHISKCASYTILENFLLKDFSLAKKCIDTVLVNNTSQIDVTQILAEPSIESYSSLVLSHTDYFLDNLLGTRRRAFRNYLNNLWLEKENPPPGNQKILVKV